MRLLTTLLARLLPFGGFKKRSDALELFRAVSWYEIDLEPYLKKFSKSSHGKRDTSYKLRVSSGAGENRLSPGPYRDAEYTMALYKTGKTWDDVPDGEDHLACIGFDIEKINIVKVLQIQGAPNKHSELKVLKWERMLLAILIDWAKQNKFRQVRVIPARSQHWYRDYRSGQMFMHYDVTARRSGFSFDYYADCYIMRLT